MKKPSIEINTAYSDKTGKPVTFYYANRFPFKVTYYRLDPIAMAEIEKEFPHLKRLTSDRFAGWPADITTASRYWDLIERMKAVRAAKLAARRTAAKAKRLGLAAKTASKAVKRPRKAKA